MIDFPSTSVSQTTFEPGSLSREAWYCIWRKATRLASRPGFTRADRDDLAQELALWLWMALRRFDPARGSETAFISTILKRAGNSLLRRCSCRKRGRLLRHCSILNRELNDDCKTELNTKDEAERAIDLRHDVRVVIKQLPPHLRTLAEQLQAYSITEIARQRNISRHCIYEDIKTLRSEFASLSQKEG
jgi:RNA polymerase sigma factor (sigma-70 family)